MAKKTKPIDPNGERVRVVLTVKPVDGIELDELVELSGFETRSETIRQAIKFFKKHLEKEST